MKKLILACSAFLFISLGSYAQTDKPADAKMDSKTETPKPMAKSHDGVMMKDGKMMMNKGGKMSMMDADMTMSDGTKVMKDGTVMKKDGTKMMMKNGDMMDMSGKMMPMKADTKMKEEPKTDKK